jgi:hypothetical protein
MGGDTLLFGERGRSARVSEVPREIVECRDALLERDPATGGQSPVAAPSTDQIQPRSGELWYYGAALRCND